MEMRSRDKAERARSGDQPETQNMWIRTPTRETENQPSDQQRSPEQTKPSPQGLERTGQAMPRGAAAMRGNQGQMRRQQSYRNSVYEELFRMNRNLQGGNQAIDQSRTRNQGKDEMEEKPFF
ncbi:uncharacterized protein VP01_3179g1 [Puccinia sorghi]|uniref:Uncharacterized protein n=1 Tax=Puccinia sorghi TaxID=27349 RepID=A0A0L6V0I6_9BASI|nr:uncharacterized protein VP01_3179g1 [Puccinia sorghi]